MLGSMFLCGRDRAPVWWRLGMFAAILAVLLALNPEQLLIDQPFANDGHALAALDLAMTRTFCGAGSAFPLAYRIPHYVRDHPDARHTPLRQLAAEQAGSLNAYCAAINQPFVNNENSLTVLESWLLRVAPDLSTVQLGRCLHALRVVILVVFAGVLLDAGLAVLASVAIVVAGIGVLRTVLDLVYSLYPFLFPLILAAVTWYGLAWRMRWTRRPAGALLVAAVAGLLAGFAVNMRSSHLPVYVTFFAVFELASLLRARAEKRGEGTGAWRLAACAVFVLGYFAFQYLAISRHLPSGVTYSASYHTVAHPLVLSLAVPENDLSRREGIVWEDAAGTRLAQRMLPDAVYLGPSYDRALFMYYRYLWRAHPREMAGIYISKFMIVGRPVIAALRGVAGLKGRVFALILKPLALIPNGICLLLLFGAIAVASLWRSTTAPDGGFALMLGLLSTAAVLLVTESALIMPFYVPSYHNYLALFFVMVSLLGWQVIVEAGWRVIGRVRSR